jgi:hypothetical protein
MALQMVYFERQHALVIMEFGPVLDLEDALGGKAGGAGFPCLGAGLKTDAAREQAGHFPGRRARARTVNSEPEISAAPSPDHASACTSSTHTPACDS